MSDHTFEEHIEKLKGSGFDEFLYYCEKCQKHIYVCDILEDILNRIKALEKEVGEALT